MSEEPDAPIEIELTSHAPPAERRRQRGGAVDGPVPVTVPAGSRSVSEPPSSSGAPGGWFDSERSRLVVTAGAAAVVALLVGWMLGRSGGETASVGDATATVTTVESDAASDAASDDVDPAFENADELPETDARFDDIEVAATVTPPVLARETTTTVATVRSGEPSPLDIALDERVLGVPMTLFAIDAERRLVEVDLGTGDVAARGEPFAVSPDQIVAGGDWVVATGYSNQSIAIDFDDGVRTSIQVPDPWSLLIDVEQGRFWSRSSVRIDSPLYDEFAFDGEPTGRSIELPSYGWPQTIDAGGLVTTSVGSVFRIGPDGHEVIARGELVELSASVAVVRTCDDDLRCGLQVVDRVTGEASWVPVLDGEETASYYPINARYGRADGSLSPDGGRLAAARSTESGETVGILDLGTGEFTEIADARLAENWTWGPTGRFIFFRELRRAMVTDTETGETFPLSADGPSWTTMTGRIQPTPER